VKTFDDYLRGMLVLEEGRRFTAYPDPLTGAAPWTIGVGHTGPEVRRGLTWTADQVEAQFAADIKHATDAVLLNFPWTANLDDARRAVLIGMTFQMGIGNLPSKAVKGSGLLGFVNFIAAVSDGRWAAAAGEMLASKWAKQTPKRAGRMARQMETGAWQYAPVL
jgi:lysozyme